MKQSPVSPLAQDNTQNYTVLRPCWSKQLHQANIRCSLLCTIRIVYKFIEDGAVGRTWQLTVKGNCCCCFAAAAVSSWWCRIKYSQILTTAKAASATIASCLLMGWGEGHWSLGAHSQPMPPLRPLGQTFRDLPYQRLMLKQGSSKSP